MSRSRFTAAIVCLTMLFTSIAPVAAQQQRDPARLWADFCHYVQIARPELAHAAGAALLEQVGDEELLDIIEASDFSDWLETGLYVRASGMQSVSATARELAAREQRGRIARARDRERIAEDIQRLGRGMRARMNATERLRAAGQYAAPQMLETLLDPEQAHLHPHVLTTMVAIGRPMVYPLSEALPKVDPVRQSQLAQVLAEIGYPMALPYFQMVLEDERTDPTARRAVEAAFNHIARNTGRSTGQSAAELFYTLGENQYTAGSAGDRIIGYDAAEGKGIIWEYMPRAGLVAVPVPGPIYADALAMRSSHYALQLDSRMDQALSLWVRSNLRRENRLPTNERDPSYPSNFQPSSYYALLAGPVRLHEVLRRALQDQDPELALDAIAALSSTAGTEALLNLDGPIQPLLEALSFPDRRVRYEAAFALTNARPTDAFPGSFQVVPVLADAVRQTEDHVALVIAEDSQQRNNIQAVLREVGYDTIAAASLSEASDSIRTAPGIDVVVIRGGVPQVMALFQRASSDYKLASVPVLAITSPGEQFRLQAEMPNERRLFTVAAGAEDATIAGVAQDAHRSAIGTPISSEQAAEYAIEALRLLRDIALISGNVYNVGDAQPALVLALNDGREEVVTGAASVLALINNSRAQQAIAAVALDTSRSTEIRRAALVSLADSATTYGNYLSDREMARMLEIVRTGNLRVDAAKAFGALTPATERAVELIIQ